jgi:oxaloacetate decarboxylase gamma subunit
MQTSQLLLEGVEIMLFGMGSVFVFLVLLIFCIRVMSFLTARFVSEPTVAQPRSASAAPAIDADADTLAAIKAAIHLHRARRA